MAEARTEAGPTGAAGATRTGAVFMEAADRTTRVEAVDTLAPGVRAAGGIFSGAPEVVADSAAADRRAARQWRGRAGREASEVAGTVEVPTAVLRARQAVIHLAHMAAGPTDGPVAVTAVDTLAVGQQTAPMVAVRVLAMATAAMAEILAATAHRVLADLTVAGTVVHGRLEQGIPMQTRGIRATDGTVPTTDQHRTAAIQG